MTKPLKTVMASGKDLSLGDMSVAEEYVEDDSISFALAGSRSDLMPPNITFNVPEDHPEDHPEDGVGVELEYEYEPGISLSHMEFARSSAPVSPQRQVAGMPSRRWSTANTPSNNSGCFCSGGMDYESGKRCDPIYERNIRGIWFSDALRFIVHILKKVSTQRFTLK